jgi:AhpD family alkylhydroperoxidase
MPLEQRDKERAAIGASIGANCQPCIEHHLAAGREAGLSEAELDEAVATAHAIQHEAIELLSARIDELFGHGGAPPEPAAPAPTSKARELVALGVSVGANSHPPLHLHLAPHPTSGSSPIRSSRRSRWPATSSITQPS